MANSNRPLRQNPFTTYRDPVTGEWIVVKPNNEVCIPKQKPQVA
ncbi:hypothetical protein [Oxynema aestuarii]|nr:hypothetical protein [Oxynema aestuarii]